MAPQITQIKCVCKRCGKEFMAIASRVKNGKAMYCSNECRIIAVGMLRRRKVKCTCKKCGKEFLRKPTEIRRGRGIYCSKKCFVKDIENTVKCNCIVCGKEFDAYGSQIKCGMGVYCSIDCARIHRVGPNTGNWKGGISFEPYCPKFNKEFKERVRAYFGYKCFMCGEKQNGTKLSIHHVDYDKKVCCNDNVPLFVPLCKRHHAKTNHNDREAWSAYFRMGIYQHTGGTMKTYYTKEEMKNKGLPIPA